mgnify:CR=1 FL=1
MWVAYALAAAFFAGLNRTLMKAATSTTTDRAIVYSRYLLAAVPAALLLAFIEIPRIDPLFYPFAVLACISDVTAIVFMSRGLRLSDMSRTVPLLSFTPVFLLLTGFIILGEIPSFLGLVGVLVVVAGSYLLHIERNQQSLLDPFRMILQNRGARYMLGAAACFSLTAPFFKQAILRTSPLFTLAVTLPFSTVLLSVHHLVRKKRDIRELLPGPQDWKILLLLGCSVFGVALSINLAINEGLVSYAISIKRLSILINILFGALIFGEKRFLQSLSAGVVMIAGAILILIH